MADEADAASDRMEWEAQFRSRQRKPVGLQPTGYCHFCDDPVGDSQTFCDVGCRDDFARVEQMEKIAGKRRL